MKFLIVYITVSGGEQTERYAQRFCSSFRNFPPGSDNWDLEVIANGGPPKPDISRHFTGLKECFITRHHNSGHDIGAYIDVARLEPNYDALLCCGQSVYFHRPGWLKRLTEVWNEHGPGMYGFYASNLIRKHLNTTCFAVAPQLLRGWNQKVETKEQRYAFEHGENAFWRQVMGLGHQVRLVMWNHDLAPWLWRSPPVENEFWRGDQSQCLMWCSHTDRFQNAVKGTRKRWSNNADRGLRQ